MNKKDLLSFLQDIWEEDGMFNYLKINYSKYNLEIIKNILIVGVTNNVFEIYRCTSTKQILVKNDFLKLSFEDSLKTIVEHHAWEMEKSIYEVIFKDKDKGVTELFINKIIPTVFSKYILL